MELADNAARLSTALRAYKESDHDESLLDSPFLLEMNESLIGLNREIENLIRRIDPSYRLEERD